MLAHRDISGDNTSELHVLTSSSSIGWNEFLPPHLTGIALRPLTMSYVSWSSGNLFCLTCLLSTSFSWSVVSVSTLHCFLLPLWAFSGSFAGVFLSPLLKFQDSLKIHPGKYFLPSLHDIYHIIPRWCCMCVHTHTYTHVCTHTPLAYLLRGCLTISSYPACPPSKHSLLCNAPGLFLLCPFSGSIDGMTMYLVTL